MADRLEHLEAGQRVRILRAFPDLFGLWHRPPEEWQIVAIEVDAQSSIAMFRIVVGGGERTVRVDLKRADAPRLGRLGEWFARVTEPPWPAPAGAAPPIPPALAPLHRALLDGDLEAAEASVRALVGTPDYAGEALQVLAEQVEGVASAVLPLRPAAGAWAYERAIVLWYGWGSMATSGGDGAARLPLIKAALRRRDAALKPD